MINSTAVNDRVRKSRWPAVLDLAQSASGLFLALFMWAHMFLVSSILLGKDAMYAVTRFFEGFYFFGRSYPAIVGFVVIVVIVVFIAHAGLALRKFPANYRQYKTFLGHQQMMRHEDTTLWFVQVFTGFAMFFLASIHLYTMLSNPGEIGPYASSDRVWSGMMWPLYLLLLLAVEFHGGIGLYRLAAKWGWLQGHDADATRRKLKLAKWVLTVFFLILGLLTLAAYIKIGIEHRDRAGERYVPTVSSTCSPVRPTTGIDDLTSDTRMLS
ncbi:MAG: fumarate reductase cytochrome b subunit [Gammaproteobacteria bacterium]|nr:fumarate reductase cytochrome b subunit [Gammaproteobacteria bacterium]